MAAPLHELHFAWPKRDSSPQLHDQLKRACSDQALWGRAITLSLLFRYGLRLLHQYEGRKGEWGVLLRNRFTPVVERNFEPFQPEQGKSPARIELPEADAKRLHALTQGLGGRAPHQQVGRRAVSLLLHLTKAVREGAVLEERSREPGKPARKLELRELVRGDVDADGVWPDDPGASAMAGAGGGPSRQPFPSPSAPPGARPFDREFAEDLLYLADYVRALNLHIATALVKSAAQIEAVYQRHRDDHGRVRDDAAVEAALAALGVDIRLRKLHAHFRRQQRGTLDARVAEGIDIDTQKPSQATRRRHWLRCSAAVQSYLRRREHPEHATPLLAGKAAPWWRHWARTRWEKRGVIEVSEIDAAIDPIAVLRHYILSQRKGTELMTARDLQRLLTEYLGLRHTQHLRALYAVAGAINRDFYELTSVPIWRLHRGSSARLSREALLASVAAAAADPTGAGRTPLAPAKAWRDYSGAQRRLALGFSLLLEWAGVIRTCFRWDNEGKQAWQLETRVRAVTSAEVPRLRALAWGAVSSVSGLSHILHEGITPNPEAGRVTLLTGGPGTGRSTLALQLSADVATRGRVAFYLSVESDATVYQRLVQYGLLNGRYQVLREHEYEALMDAGSETGALHGERGLLVLIGESRARKPKMAEWIAEQARRLDPPRTTNVAGVNVRRHAWRCLVVDSIDALNAPSRREAQASLRFWSGLFKTIEKNQFWGILIGGQADEALPTLSHLADMVVRMVLEERSQRRTIEIVKSRNQSADGGPHLCELRDGIGLRIYPNLHSLQRTSVRTPRPPLDPARVIPLPAPIREAFRAIYAKDLHGRAEPPAALLGILQGSSVLMTGAPGSGKASMMLTLLSERLRLVRAPHLDVGPSGGCLVVSFTNSEIELLTRIREAKSLERRLTENVADLRIRWYSPGDHLTADHVLGSIYRIIRRGIAEGIPFERVVIEGLGAIDHHSYPAIAAEPSYISTLVSMLSTEGITAFYVTNRHGDRCPLYERHAQLFDYVMTFERGEMRADEGRVVMRQHPFRIASNVELNAEFSVEGGDVAPALRRDPAASDAAHV